MKDETWLVREDAEQYQHWMKLISAVRNLAAAKVWFEFRREPSHVPREAIIVETPPVPTVTRTQ